jgi:putative ABC transport system permease protein
MRLIDRGMALFEGVLMALDSIRSNKARAGLTILGIAVGVFVVTAMSAAIHGINSGVERSLRAAGPTTFFITKWPMAMNSCTGSADSCPWRRYPGLTTFEAAAIERLPSIQVVTAHVNSSASIRHRDIFLPGVAVEAYTSGWTETTGADIVRGRTFTHGENAAAAPVLLVNGNLASQLFGSGDPLGRHIQVGGQQFRVIGVYSIVGNIFEPGNTPSAVVPFESGRRRLGIRTGWLDLAVRPHDGVDAEVALDDAIARLRTLRGLKPAEANTFFVSTQERVLELYNSIIGAFFLVMLILGSIGLLVGGVGVVAIMMISVTERTREIGVRKALGATRGTILWQFLVEAATLTTIGAVIGLVIGGGLTMILRSLTPIEAAIPPLAIVLALIASAITGVLFGLFPAARAARLDPVDALRYE